MFFYILLPIPELVRPQRNRKVNRAMNSTIRRFIEAIAACALLAFFQLPAFAAEPAWWTKQKRDCGLPANLAFNSWDGRCGRAVQTPQLDPRQIALQNAIPRYRAVVRSLADKFNVLDKQSWLNLPLGSEAAFFNAANQLHKLLVNKADANRFRVGKLREELAGLSEVRDSYPGLIATARADIEKLQRERTRLTGALVMENRQLELAQKATKQLETRAHRYAQDTKRNKSTVQNWLAVLLPPGMAETAAPKPYESALDWAPSVQQRGRAAQQGEPPQPVVVARAQASKYGHVRLDITPAPLTGTAENAVAQLEADANALAVAVRANTWELANQVNELRSVSAQLRQTRTDLQDERAKVEGEVKTFRARLNVATRSGLEARDNLTAAKATFLYRAAESWVWENAKKEAIDQAKNEVRRLVAAKWFGTAYRDLADEEMHALFNAGKRNIFGLADKALSSGDGLHEVMNRIKTLQTHGQGYMQEAVRLASLGSPREIKEFVDGMYKEFGDDSEKLVTANLDALNIPEPLKSISAKYFVKKASE